MQELVEDWVEERLVLVLVLPGIYPDERRPRLVHGEEDGKAMGWRRPIGKVALGMLRKLAAEKVMGTPVSLLTFKRAVGGGTAAGAAASLGRAADCAEDVNIHLG